MTAPKPKIMRNASENTPGMHSFVPRYMIQCTGKNCTIGAGKNVYGSGVLVTALRE